MNLKKTIRTIPDYPKKGILFRDLTTLLENEHAFSSAIQKLKAQSQKFTFNKIAAIEARGFIFAAPLAYELKKPLILLRKPKKLPSETHTISYELEYGEAGLEIHKNALKKGDSVLIIDDLIATGGTADAAKNLIYKCESTVAGFLFLIDLFELGGAAKLKKADYKVESLITFSGA